ncbi:AfsR/SARP family transcriptional regulator [Asanoa ishikariensis]|uniref:AfsR/SARP family transcriptional regulator n=1 Tax=Asanoa ishikariensis TaxID=137265 RepID=UPI0015A188E6|nr:AfsR/SARP family transcriptional regulator [Asanoa ishikariensis]
MLLAILLLRPNTLVTSDALIDSLWSQSQRPPASAAANLQSYVSDLRRTLHSAALPGRERIVTARGGYLLRVDQDELDSAVFERLAADGRRHHADGRPAAAADSLLRALALWRGPVLDGLVLPEAVWLEAGRMEELRIAATEEAFDARLGLGAHVELVAELRSWTARHPLRERSWGQLMLALYRCGRRAEALAAYEQSRRSLDRELAVRPGPALVELRERIEAADPDLELSTVGAPSVPLRQLPADVFGFTGRAELLRQLDTGAKDRPILAITGTAGVGKTALAVHWAHDAAARFPDGQLFLNLRGFDPSGPPLTSAEAIRVLLEALGVAPHRIPSTTEGQAGLYRSVLADRRVLLLLDNARDAEQVRPLLPGAPTSLAVVTSRDRLLGLAATDGARIVSVDLPDADEAGRLFGSRVGEHRVSAEPQAAAALVETCARLPLALAIVGAYACAHPQLSLTSLADQLRSSANALASLAGGDAATDLRCVFLWSYRALSPAAAELFRLLGVHAGADIGAPALGSLAGIDATATRRLLLELSGANLLTEYLPGRYTCHDLLRAYARELAGDPPVQQLRLAAERRLVDHYLHTAHAAALRLNPHRDTDSPAPAAEGVTPERLDSPEQALTWFRAEHANLLHAVELADAAGHEIQAWKMAGTLTNYLDRHGCWQDLVTAQRAALRAARRLADPVAEASARRGLGLAYASGGQLDEAPAHYRAALELFRYAGDHIGQAHTHRNLAWVRGQQGNHFEALRHSESALELFRRAGHRAGEANSLNAVGWYRALIGAPADALALCQEALEMLQDLGHTAGEAYAWDSLGYIHSRLGDHDRAVTCFHHGVALFRQARDRYCLADVLTHLGDAQRDAGDLGAARAAWREAGDILDQLGHPDGEAVRVKLHKLDQLVSVAPLQNARRDARGESAASGTAARNPGIGDAPTDPPAVVGAAVTVDVRPAAAGVETPVDVPRGDLGAKAAAC